MRTASHPTPFVKWLRRQRRLSWWAILLCLLVRIADAAQLAGDPNIVPVAQPRRQLFGRRYPSSKRRNRSRC